MAAADSLFPLGPDTTPYRKLSSEGVRLEKLGDKTFLSIAAALSQVLSDFSPYKKLYVSRPVVQIGKDIGALRVRTYASKDCPSGDWPGKAPDGKYHPAVVLDLDYWLLMPRR